MEFTKITKDYNAPQQYWQAQTELADYYIMLSHNLYTLGRKIKKPNEVQRTTLLSRSVNYEQVITQADRDYKKLLRKKNNDIRIYEERAN